MAHDSKCPKGDGGNKTLTNQDEKPILDRTTQGLQTRSEGMQERGRH
ncbi:hypothetical protein [Streptomyces himalayensis]|uniref:Uncharacterized protein n=1 Tax=Streptomyces himalayensis subsp. himalayensis TaxID=2756131 RepID=A0A7W0ID65_9ACTN|nr:hypothetical protein [Streptomyces himalayensis]MBA2951440.1 hypothetical protein [Streptomyces himalayensis subsp. himalayensis]